MWDLFWEHAVMSQGLIQGAIVFDLISKKLLFSFSRKLSNNPNMKPDYNIFHIFVYKNTGIVIYITLKLPISHHFMILFKTLNYLMNNLALAKLLELLTIPAIS